jgi:hypothetical protein
MKEKISQVQKDEFINNHWGIEVSGIIYGILYEIQEEADQALAEGQKKQATKGRKGTHVDLSKGKTREIEVNEKYSKGYELIHGVNDGYHDSSKQSVPHTGHRTHLIVNV